jgi:hypothetical protein
MGYSFGTGGLRRVMSVEWLLSAWLSVTQAAHAVRTPGATRGRER